MLGKIHPRYLVILPAYLKGPWFRDMSSQKRGSKKGGLSVWAYPHTFSVGVLPPGMGPGHCAQVGLVHSGPGMFVRDAIRWFSNLWSIRSSGRWLWSSEVRRSQILPVVPPTTPNKPWRAQAVVHADVWLIKSLGNPSDAMAVTCQTWMTKWTKTGSVLHLEKYFPIHR